MNFLKHVNALFFTLLLVASPSVVAECNLPAGPIIPDGNVASEDELVAAQKGIRAFQDKLISYRLCLDGEQKALNPEAEDTTEKSAEIGELYNASVDAEDKVAQEFNTAVRAFKARQ